MAIYSRKFPAQSPLRPPSVEAGGEASWSASGGKEMPRNTEQEIIELEKRLAEKRQELVKKKEVGKHDRELIKEIIKEKTEIPAPSKITPIAPKKTVIKKAQALKSEPKERQIKLLADLAFDKGVIYATEVAKNLDSPYILDEFHDTLVDELYNYLIKQGKLKQL